MRFWPLLILMACPFEEPDTTCPTVPCVAGEVCTVEGDCIRIQPRRDAGVPDGGPAPDAGPVCGNGVAEGDEPCDDGNDIETDGCRSGCVAARCGDGIRRIKSEDCDEGEALPSQTCSEDCRRIGVFDGSEASKAALSCRHLKRDHPGLPTAGYWVDLDGDGEDAPVRVLCEQGLDGGGWTHMAHVGQGDRLWHAFQRAQGEPGGDAAWGLRLDRLLQDDPEGQDIEYVMALRGTFAGAVVYSPFYSGLKGEAFNPEPVFEVFDTDGFSWREPGVEIQFCVEALWHRTEAWNWAAARG